MRGERLTGFPGLEILGTGMARKLRLEYEGAIYHVMDRGDRREDIFWDDEDREQFMETLDECCSKTDWQVHSYCLMLNHFHLIIETPQPNLSLGMQWFLGTYSSRFNRRHKEFGHVFAGRYKPLMVDGSGNGYLKTVCDYVHLNPVRAKLLKPEQHLKEYRWSSFPEYLRRPSKRRSWLRVDRLLGEWGIAQDNAAGRREFECLMEERKAQEQSVESKDWKRLRRGWCWGDKTFKEMLLEMVGEKRAEHHYGEELAESAEQKAQRLVGELLEQAGWTEEELSKQPKSAAAKVRMAARLRAQTTLSWKWIARRLQMGQWRSAANAVRLARQ